MKRYILAVVAMAAMLLTGCKSDTTVEIPVGALSVTPLTASINPGTTVQITAILAPDVASDKTVTWSSSDDNTATVDATGMVTAVAYGEAVITATAGEFTATATISVVPNVYVSGSIGDRPAVWLNGALLWEASESGVPVGQMVVDNGDIYIAGYSLDMETYINHAWVCKNGEKQYLAVDESYGSTYGEAVAVKGSDIYAAGSGTDASWNSRAIVWKNGEPQYLDLNMQGYASDVAVDANDNVYVVGYTTDYIVMNPTLWKNGVAQVMDMEGGTYGSATSVFLSGNDVYVAGEYQTGSSYPYTENLVIWKNGQIYKRLHSGTDTPSVLDFTVTPTGEVYAVGAILYAPDPINNPYTTISQAVLWANGTETVMSDRDRNANFTSIFMFGNDMYMAGAQERVSNLNQILLYKNAEQLNIDVDGYASLEARSVFVTE